MNEKMKLDKELMNGYQEEERYFSITRRMMGGEDIARMDGLMGKEREKRSRNFSGDVNTNKRPEKKKKNFLRRNSRR